MTLYNKLWEIRKHMKTSSGWIESSDDRECQLSVNENNFNMLFILHTFHFSKVFSITTLHIRMIKKRLLVNE